MAALDDPRTLGRTRLSFADEADIDEFVQTLSRYEGGELNADQWRAFRLVRGTYAQRQTGDLSMLRVKIPQGILDGPQLRALADVAERWSRGFGHITTRQNVQFHFMKLHDVEPAMRALAEAGLTTREACGNSVRNITACPYAGVAADEAFDVTPYSEALTRHLLRHPLSSTLPRKFKIGFEGCREDHAFVAINDIGWRARRGPDGTRGFRVTVGGGTSILCRSGWLLFDFLPAGEILNVADAVIQVYARLGDYKHKQRNRMKFLIEAIGFDAWRAAFEATLAEIRAEGGRPLPFDPERPPLEAAPPAFRPPVPPAGETAVRVAAGRVQGPGILPEVRPVFTTTEGEFRRWARSNVRPQRQEGYSVVTVTVPLGDVTATQLRALADLASVFGDGAVRTTHDQNLVMRWVPQTDVHAVYRHLAAAGLGREGAHTLSDVTSCPGAESCRLAVTQSRGLGKLLSDHLRDRPELTAAAGSLNIKISGCPNGCGQHHVAGLGFQGSVRKLGSRVVPQYFVMVGGGSGEGGAQFGRLAAKIPARRVPAAVERLIELYRAEREPGESAREFLGRVELGRVKQVLAGLEALTEADSVPADFVDLGDDHEFQLEAMEGECSA